MKSGSSDKGDLGQIYYVQDMCHNSEIFNLRQFFTQDGINYISKDAFWACCKTCWTKIAAFDITHRNQAYPYILVFYIIKTERVEQISDYVHMWCG